MKSKYILITIAFACLRLHAQPLQEGQQIPQTIFPHTFNHPNPTLNLNQYKNKIIVFDFWNTNCIGCIQSFPKLDSLQKKFNDQLQIILVNRESVQKTKEFFDKRKKIKIPQLPFICNDTQLKEFFPHEGNPAYAWLDNNHRFQLITEGFNVNEQTIAKLMNNEKLNVATRQSAHTKIKNVINKEYEERLQFYSYLTNCIIGHQESLSTTVRNRTVSIQERCASVAELYVVAFNENGKYNFNRVGRLMTDFEEPQKYLRSKIDTDQQEWRSNYAYNYELLVPKSDTLLRYIYMKQDLQRYFNLSANVRACYKKCIVLESLNDSLKIKTKGGPSVNTFFRSSVSRDITEPQRELRNKPFHFLTHSFAVWLEREYDMPFENAVAFDGYIDISLSADAVESLNITTLNKELKKYNLVLVEKEIAIQCLVLSDKEKPVK